MTECLKQKNGNCIGCPVLEQGIKYIDLGAVWQSAILYVAEGEEGCPPGYRPDIVHHINSNGDLKEIIIGGAVVEIRKSV